MWVCECVCGSYVKSSCRCPLCVDKGISEGSSRSCRACRQESAHTDTYTHTHTHTHRKLTPHKQAYLLPLLKKQYKIPDTNTHKHRPYLSRPPQEHHPKSHTVNKQYWRDGHTHIHTPSASVLSSECPFRLVRLEIWPFFCKG